MELRSRHNGEIAKLMEDENLTCVEAARRILQRAIPNIYQPGGGGGPGGGGPGGGGPGGGCPVEGSSLTIPQADAIKEYGGIATEHMAAFLISEEQIEQIRQFSTHRGHIPFDKDCVIIALQLLGLIDTKTADLMRITAIRSIGYDYLQITKLMERTTNFKHNFKDFTTYEDFYNAINRQLAIEIETEQKAIFCGITRTNGSRHAFIIFLKKPENTIHVLDPMVFGTSKPISCIIDISGTTCPLHTTDGVSGWCILYRSEYQLTRHQLLQAGFINL